MITYKTFLMKLTGSTWGKVIDIKDYPDIFGTPELLEKTTLSNASHTYDEGIEELEALEFTANYDYEEFTTLRAMKGVESTFAIWFGGTGDGDDLTPTGEFGKFEFDGKLSVRISGKGVNEVREMVVRIAPSSEITLGD